MAIVDNLYSGVTKIAQSRYVEVKKSDYIVIGSEPTGCVTAARLVEYFEASVLLLEAGSPNNNPILKMPAGFIKMLSGSKYSFQETTPQTQLDGRLDTARSCSRWWFINKCNGLYARAAFGLCEMARIHR